MNNRTLLTVLGSTLAALALAACGDDTGGAGGGSGGSGQTTGTTTTTTATTTSASTTTGGEGGGGTGGEGAGGEGTGGSDCAPPGNPDCGCADIFENPELCGPPELCPGSVAEEAFVGLIDCICGPLCNDVCADTACGGVPPSEECGECFNMECTAELDTCFAN